MANFLLTGTHICRQLAAAEHEDVRRHVVMEVRVVIQLLHLDPRVHLIRSQDRAAEGTIQAVERPHVHVQPEARSVPDLQLDLSVPDSQRVSASVFSPGMASFSTCSTVCCMSATEGGPSSAVSARGPATWLR